MDINGILNNRKRALAYYYKNKKIDAAGILRNMKEIVRLNKVKVVMWYSNPRGCVVCNNCGNQDIDVLCLDHLYGYGNKHRKEVGTQGSGFYHWIIRNNYPSGFQILCHNCNVKKSRIGLNVKTVNTK